MDIVLSTIRAFSYLVTNALFCSVLVSTARWSQTNVGREVDNKSDREALGRMAKKTIGLGRYEAVL